MVANVNYREETGCRSIRVAMVDKITYIFLSHAYHHHHDCGANLATKSVYWWLDDASGRSPHLVAIQEDSHPILSDTSSYLFKHFSFHRNRWQWEAEHVSPRLTCQLAQSDGSVWCWGQLLCCCACCCFLCWTNLCAFVDLSDLKHSCKDCHYRNDARSNRHKRKTHLPRPGPSI